jgi:xanthosine utilization system XapX-like protein
MKNSIQRSSRKPLHEGAWDCFCEYLNNSHGYILTFVVACLVGAMIYIAQLNSPNAPAQAFFTVIGSVLLLMLIGSICRFVAPRTKRWQRRHYHDHGVH